MNISITIEIHTKNVHVISKYATNIIMKGAIMFTEEELSVITVTINFQADAIDFVESQGMDHNFTDEFLEVLHNLQRKLPMPSESAR